MRTVETTLYQYDELPTDAAKSRARDWYAQLAFTDSCDWDFVYEDADRMAELMGIEIDRRSYRTRGGANGHEPCIYFSGFSSQGDGAYFEGTYRYKKGAVKAVTAECGGTDAELIAIAQGLQDIQRRNFYRLYAKCTHSGHYSHSGCMGVDVEDRENQYRNLGEDEELLRQVLRDFADWIYERLEKEYDYQTSDEAVEESLRANEYEFEEDGSRA